MKISKLLLALIAVVVICASIGLGYYIAEHPAVKTEKVTVDTASGTVTTETQRAIISTETDADISDLILGEWTDNANFSGYTFMKDGQMKVTYFNMDLINLSNIIDGTFSGTYTLEGDKITIAYTVYNRAVKNTYTVSVDDNVMVLREKSGKEAIYVRKGEKSTMKNLDPALLGAWKSNLTGFEFEETGTVKITFIDLTSMGINIPINGTVEGIYSISDEGILSIQYSIYTGVISKKYTYSVDGAALTMNEIGGDEAVYQRVSEN